MGDYLFIGRLLTLWPLACCVSFHCNWWHVRDVALVLASVCFGRILPWLVVGLRSVANRSSSVILLSVCSNGKAIKKKNAAVNLANTFFLLLRSNCDVYSSQKCASVFVSTSLKKHAHGRIFHRISNFDEFRCIAKTFSKSRKNIIFCTCFFFPSSTHQISPSVILFQNREHNLQLCDAF